MTLTLFHSPGTRSVRALWLLEELGLPYDLKTNAYDSKYFASDEFQAINPMGKVPALYDGETLIIESVAIIQYLLSKAGAPDLAVQPDDPEYASYLQWLHLPESGLANYVAVSFGHGLGIDRYQVTEAFDGYCRYQVEKAIGMAEAQLDGKDYILQRGFSAADISLGYGLIFATECSGAKLPPSVAAYLGRLMERPTLQKALSDIPENPFELAS